MTVVAGETEATQAPVVQSVDATALAHSIVTGVFQKLESQGALQSTGTTKQERQSAFKAKAEALLKDDTTNKESVAIMVDLLEAMGSDLTVKQREEAIAAAREAGTKAVHSELGRMVERYAASSGNPDLIRELKPSIMSKAIEFYNSHPGAVAAWERDGSVDWGIFDKSVVDQIKKWGGAASGGTEGKPAKGPAMKNDAPAGAPESTNSLSKDDLDGRQQELFNAQVSFAIKNMNMKREDAEKRALDQINAAEKKVKEGKSKR